MNRAALYSTGVICAFRSHCPPVPDGVTAEARGTTRIMKLSLPLSLGDISLSRLVVPVRRRRRRRRGDHFPFSVDYE